MTFLGLNIAFTGLTCCLLPVLTRWPEKHKKYKLWIFFSFWQLLACRLVQFICQVSKYMKRVCRLLSHWFHNDVAAGPLCDRRLHHSGVHHGTSPESTLHPGVNIVNGKVFITTSYQLATLTLYISNPNFRHCMQQLVLGSCSQHFSSDLSFPP